MEDTVGKLGSIRIKDVCLKKDKGMRKKVRAWEKIHTKDAYDNVLKVSKHPLHSVIRKQITD